MEISQICSHPDAAAGMKALSARIRLIFRRREFPAAAAERVWSSPGAVLGCSDPCSGDRGHRQGSEHGAISVGERAKFRILHSASELIVINHLQRLPKFGSSHERAGAAPADCSFGRKGGKFQFLRIIRTVFLFLEGLIRTLLFSPCPWLSPSQVTAGKLPRSESKAFPSQESSRDPKHLPGSLVCGGLGAPPVSGLVLQEGFFPCLSGIWRIMTNFTIWEGFQGNEAAESLVLLL